MRYTYIDIDVFAIHFALPPNPKPEPPNYSARGTLGASLVALLIQLHTRTHNQVSSKEAVSQVHGEAEIDG